DIAGDLTMGDSTDPFASIQLGSTTAPGHVDIESGGSLTIWGSTHFGGNGIFNSGNGNPLANPGDVDNAGDLIVKGSSSQLVTINVPLTNESGGVIDAQGGTL